MVPIIHGYIICEAYDLLGKGVGTTTVLHEPRLDTILMVEKAIQRARSYPTRKELWLSLPRKLQYQTFSRDLGVPGEFQQDSTGPRTDRLDLSKQSKAAEAVADQHQAPISW